MNSKSNDQGRAYEYLWIHTLYAALSNHRKTRILKNSSYEANKRAWNSISSSLQSVLIISAQAAIDYVLELEPNLLDDNGDELLLIPVSDDAGMKGDVRDIIIERNGIQWEVGLSIKHNHEAIKHSRLSNRIDFGQEWFGDPCSRDYWNDVKPIFDFLKEYKGKIKWSSIPNKESRIYIPLLTAFMNEIKRAYSNDLYVPRKMVEYLIGIKDYYKIISHDSQQVTFIRTFNMNKTLNMPSANHISKISVPVLDLPTRIVDLGFKRNSNNTVEMILDNGWQLSFRIHNASTFVEPSLKFDVQFIGMPVSVMTIVCYWNKRNTP